jgi:hypothetical protein
MIVSISVAERPQMTASLHKRDANIVSIVAETEPMTWVRLAMTAQQAQQLADRLDAALAARKEAMP